MQPGNRHQQYYEISPSPVDSLQQQQSPVNGPDAGQPTPHLHPIGLCAIPAGEIIPGSVFGDPSMGHLHYHIYPSRRALEPRGHYQRPEVKERSMLEMHDSQNSKNKCQCQQHLHHHQQQQQQQTLRVKRDLENGADDESGQRLQPPALPPRPPPRPAGRRYEVASTSSTERIQSSQMDRGFPILHLVRCRFGNQGAVQPGQPGVNPELAYGDAFGMGPPPPHLPGPPTGGPYFSHHHHLQAAAAAAHHIANHNFMQRMNRCSHACGHVGGGQGSPGNCCKKYVVLCCLCGGLSAAVGALFLAVHAVLSAHTASLRLFETVPSYIPGTMLIFMGLFTMLLARRKYRYGFLMKVCGSVSVVCALVCVLVTVTTTVVHMSRLQGLRECVYTARAKSCTCYGVPQIRASDPGVLFEGTPNCEAVHGALYACLRALFGVSVAGILACIFSCMLVYQLLSHEKKKMYWEQLELRCRSLYGQGAGAGLANSRPPGTCGCCNDCGGIGPWWAQSPGNLYTPNPDMTPARRWRLPWTRSRGPAPSPADTSYGFHHQSNNPQNDGLVEMPNGSLVPYGIALHHSQANAGTYSVLQAAARDDPYGQNSAAGYSVLDAAVPLWGPPPPYSDPNSPARRPVIAFPGTERPRMGKRIDSFPLREAVEYGRSTEIKRPSANYENAEQISNETESDPSESNDVRASRNNKHKKMLKGVENAAFNPNEPNQKPQSESELYFGDVSSCCGPESSLYDVATDKEATPESHHQSEAGTSRHLSRESHFPKRLSSRRSRRVQHHHQPELELIDMPAAANNTSGSSSSSHSSNDDQLNNKPVVYTSAEVDYEVIRQSRYGSPEHERFPDKAQPQVERRNDSDEEEDQEVRKTLETEEEERKRKMYEDEVRPVNV